MKEDERDLIGGENWLYSRYNQMCKQMFYERTGSLGVWPAEEMWNFINRPVHDNKILVVIIYKVTVN